MPEQEIASPVLHGSIAVRITHLYRYPVKSFAGEALASAQLGAGGIPFDRRYMIVDGFERRKGRPLTARQVPGMLAFRAGVNGGNVMVTDRAERAFEIGDTLVEHLRSTLGRPVWIQEDNQTAGTFHDAHDLLVINAASVRELSRERGAPVNVLRFRPNIILDGEDAVAYAEREWIAHRFRLGEAEVDAVTLDVRCALTTIDPESLEIDPSFLKHLVEHHNQCFGVYCQVNVPGRIEIGDEWRPL